MTTDAVSWTTLDTPIGELLVVAGANGIREVRFDADPDHVPDAHVDPASTAMVRRAVVQLEEYFAGDRAAFDVAIDPVRGTEFQRRAWDALVTIPYGATRTYGEQAAAMGAPRAVRAVGAANGRNPIPVIVPCHRVVGADGSLTGYAGGTDRKRWLLDHERRGTTIR